MQIYWIKFNILTFLYANIWIYIDIHKYLYSHLHYVKLIFVICTDFKYTWGDYWKRHNGRENNQGRTKFFSLLLLSCWVSGCVSGMEQSEVKPTLPITKSTTSFYVGMWSAKPGNPHIERKWTKWSLLRKQWAERNETKCSVVLPIASEVPGCSKER